MLLRIASESVRRQSVHMKYFNLLPWHILLTLDAEVLPTWVPLETWQQIYQFNFRRISSIWHEKDQKNKKYSCNRHFPLFCWGFCVTKLMWLMLMAKIQRMVLWLFDKIWRGIQAGQITTKGLEVPIQRWFRTRFRRSSPNSCLKLSLKSNFRHRFRYKFRDHLWIYVWIFLWTFLLIYLRSTFSGDGPWNFHHFRNKSRQKFNSTLWHRMCNTIYIRIRSHSKSKHPL